jgi:hypothetical protein
MGTEIKQTPIIHSPDCDILCWELTPANNWRTSTKASSAGYYSTFKPDLERCGPCFRRQVPGRLGRGVPPEARGWARDQMPRRKERVHAAKAGAPPPLAPRRSLAALGVVCKRRLRHARAPLAAPGRPHAAVPGHLRGGGWGRRPHGLLARQLARRHAVQRPVAGLVLACRRPRGHGGQGARARGAPLAKAEAHVGGRATATRPPRHPLRGPALFRA